MLGKTFAPSVMNHYRPILWLTRAKTLVNARNIALKLSRIPRRKMKSSNRVASLPVMLAFVNIFACIWLQWPDQRPDLFVTYQIPMVQTCSPETCRNVGWLASQVHSGTVRPKLRGIHRQRTWCSGPAVNQKSSFPPSSRRMRPSWWVPVRTVLAFSTKFDSYGVT